MTIDDKIRDEKISTVKIDKEIQSDQRRVIWQTQLTYSPLQKDLEKQTKRLKIKEKTNKSN